LFCWLGQPSYKSVLPVGIRGDIDWWYCTVTLHIYWIYSIYFHTLLLHFLSVSNYFFLHETYEDFIITSSVNKIMITVEMLRRILFCFHIQSDIFLKAVTVLLYSHNNIQENVTWLIIAWFQVQFGYNMHSWIFQRPQINSTRPSDWCYFAVFEKLPRACYIQIALETMLLSIQTINIVFILKVETIFYILTWENVNLSSMEISTVIYHQSDSIKQSSRWPEDYISQWLTWTCLNGN
jgi:hypothetical protein